MYRLTNKEISDLIHTAFSIRKLSYSPYSKFAVGSALLCDDGEIYGGCNIENSSYSATVCAERVALFKAISNGERGFEAIAIVCEKGDFCYPCGVCRQVMSEFCDESFRIILEGDNIIKSHTLEELLPHSFKLKD